jgi:PHD/YefM family antitoxin component YafN of YafNO toxin-antitoxin module
MHQIQLNDQLFQQAQRRAAESGFASVDEYVADVLQSDLMDEETPDLDHLFTPERLAHIDRAIAEIEAGQGYTAEEVREHFRRRRDA